MCELYPYELQVCFFAGVNGPCSPAESLTTQAEMKLASQMAKFHLENAYSVVGLQSNLYETFLLFEHYLPRFFKGAAKRFR